jgi:hypothetical protein
MRTRRPILRVAMVVCALCALGAATTWAATIPLTFQIDWGVNFWTVDLELGGAGTQSADTAVWGTFAANMTATFNPTTHAATVNALGLRPQYPSAGQISYDDMYWGAFETDSGQVQISFLQLAGDLKTGDPYSHTYTDFSVVGGTFPISLQTVMFNGGKLLADTSQGSSARNLAPNDSLEVGLSGGAGPYGTIGVTATTVVGNRRNYRVNLSLPIDFAATVDGLDMPFPLEMRVHGRDDAPLTATAYFYLTGLPGDADLSGTVDGADLNVVLSNYNQSGMLWAQGDFDANGTVDGTDLNVVLSNYNQSAGWIAAAVPEPSTLWLTAAGLVGLLACAWRNGFMI